MCGRYNMDAHPLAQLVAALTGATLQESRYNIAPTESVPVIRARAEASTPSAFGAPPYELVTMRWWLVPWWSDGPSQRYAMFNARSETMATSRAYARAFERQRCVFPLSGWIEWRKQAGGKLPYQIRAARMEGLLVAGLWDIWRKGSSPLESCAMVTTAAHERLAWVHPRMPVVLDRETADHWLDPAAPPSRLAELCRPGLPQDLVVEPLSTAINNAREKSAAAMTPVGAARRIERQHSGQPSEADGRNS